MKYKYTLAEAPRIGRKSVEGYAYSTARDFDRVSAVRVKVLPGTRHGLIKNIACDRLYLVLAGEGAFRIDGDEIPVRETDVVIVPRGTPYDYWGERLEMLLVHVPANINEADIDLEEPPAPP